MTITPPGQAHQRSEHGSLRRELGVFAAMMMGMGSIVGTGVFVSIGIGAGVAGPAVVLAIALAAVVATFNGLNSAQLAASHPVSGGTYEYGYKYLNPAMGFTAGWMFLCAKSASAATAALGFSGYLLNALGQPGSGAWLVPVAVATVVVVTLVVVGGIRRSSWTNIGIVTITLAALGYFILRTVPGAVTVGGEHFIPFFDGSGGSLDEQRGSLTRGETVSSLLHAAALMFVAFTGYGRIATLGEEVREPRRTIPRAIVVTLVLSMLLYIGVAVGGVGTVGSARFAAATAEDAAPLEVVMRQVGSPAGAWVLAIGAMTAMLGVLLNLVLGLSRVLLAMGRRGDMPGIVARLDSTGATPWVSVLVMGAAVALLALLGDVRLTWTFSAFTVLIYYAITNLAALRLPREDRMYPPLLGWGGLAACLFLAFWVEWQVWAIGLGLIGGGLVWHFIAARRRKISDENQFLG